MSEPEIAFPYKPPSDEIKVKYKHIFENDYEIKDRTIKIVFDKIMAILFLTLSLPILIILKVMYLIESLIDKESSGPLIFYYFAISKGKMIKKYKIRIIKEI